MTLNVSRNGPSTTSARVSPPALQKITSSYLIWIYYLLFKTITPSAIATGPTEEFIINFLMSPFRYLKAAIKCPWNLPFSRLNSLIPLIPSSQECPSTLSLSVPFLWTHSSRSSLSCAENCRAGCSDAEHRGNEIKGWTQAFCSLVERNLSDLHPESGFSWAFWNICTWPHGLVGQ